MKNGIISIVTLFMFAMVCFVSIPTSEVYAEDIVEFQDDFENEALGRHRPIGEIFGIGQWGSLQLTPISTVSVEEETADGKTNKFIRVEIKRRCFVLIPQWDCAFLTVQ